MDLKVLLDTPPWEWPRGIDYKFLTLLRDKDQKADPADRLIAADLAGDFTVINDGLANALLAIVENPAEPDELRAEAAGSFGAALESAFIEELDSDEFDDPEAVPISLKMYRKIKASLNRIYLDATVPKLIRRRVLEAAVRARDDWQGGAIRTAWASDDPEWKLTAAFGMKYVPGFDKEIMEALESTDPAIHFQAVEAAGSRELDAAWPHISALAIAENTERALRLTAIEALSTIRPAESIEVLANLKDSGDEEIAQAADEAMEMAEGMCDDDLPDDDACTGDDDEDDEDDED